VRIATLGLGYASMTAAACLASRFDEKRPRGAFGDLPKDVRVWQQFSRTSVGFTHLIASKEAPKVVIDDRPTASKYSLTAARTVDINRLA
jgi:hypothetical protein